MDIKLRASDQVRLESGSESVFSDITCDNENMQDVLGVQFYDIHKLQLRAREGCLKMFVIPSDWSFDDVDFGWWGDAEIVWERSRA